MNDKRNVLRVIDVSLSAQEKLADEEKGGARGIK